MSDLIRGEIRKMVTTRTGFGIVIGAALVVALGTFSTLMSVEPGRLTGPIHDQMFYFLASINLGVFALILGVSRTWPVGSSPSSPRSRQDRRFMPSPKQHRHRT